MPFPDLCYLPQRQLNGSSFETQSTIIARFCRSQATDSSITLTLNSATDDWLNTGYAGNSSILAQDPLYASPIMYMMLSNSNETSFNEKPSMCNSAIAGIVVGAVLALIAINVLVYLLLRRRRRSRGESKMQQYEETGDSFQKSELAGESNVHEVSGTREEQHLYGESKYEMEADAAHELEAKMAQELESFPVMRPTSPVELPATERKRRTHPER